MSKIHPCLWFDASAEEAAKLYTSLFRNSKIGTVARYGKSGSDISGQKQGSVMTVEFEMEGLQITGLNGGPMFKFSPSISFFVTCKDKAEIDTLWAGLTNGGSVLMELNKYPWSERYGWCQDKFGVSWQLMLGDNRSKIMPSFLFVNKLFGKGEEAVTFWTTQFPNSKILNMHKDPNTNTVMHAVFSLNGNDFCLMEGQGEHKHEMTIATSFIVNCKNQEEIDYYWDRLISGGGSPSQCGWLTDKYGVAWQVVPHAIGELMSAGDPAKSEKVMKALLQMKKIDIQKLKDAAQSHGH